MLEFNGIFWSNFAMSIFNLLLLYFILKKILFKPMTAHMEKRNQGIQDAINSAEEAKQAVEDLKKEYDAKIQAAGEEARKIINKSKDMATKEYEEVLITAKTDAGKIIEQAKEEINNEKRRAVEEIKGEVKDMVFSATTKIMKQNIDEEANSKIIEEMFN